ncbi:MAG: hypothetical protein OXE94_02730 [Aestuariivita sp.]|nr:hypothetical protein [Aestuariivita sp.]MCY4203670.1 hypothetical protein [Aestuariivita sp.]
MKDVVRKELSILARRTKPGITTFSKEMPTDWRPDRVTNPNGVLDTHFTEASAREFIATMPENVHSIEEVKLRKPRGSKGYVMKIDLDPSQKQLYVKLRLGSGKIFGCSFPYSEYNAERG